LPKQYVNNVKPLLASQSFKQISSLGELVRYIHLKPVRARIAKGGDGARSAICDSLLQDKTKFNSRLQPTFIKLGTTSNPTSLLWKKPDRATQYRSSLGKLQNYESTGEIRH